MTDLAPRSLGDIVASRPGAARVFDRVGIDYCCHGGRSLADACAAAGLEPELLAAELGALGSHTDTDWASLPPAALTDHIVSTHHVYLRDELPLLEALATKVDDAHRTRHPELVKVHALVAELRADLEPHLDREERVLFPAIRRVVTEGSTEFPFGSVANPIGVMIVEHDRAGELLADLRRATGDYQVPADGCASYLSLYQRLEKLEHDTHVHIHKENHVLFPAALHEWDKLTGDRRETPRGV